jgi:hypothetical protein
MHYTLDGRGDVLDIAVHQNARLSETTVTDILYSDHLPIMFSILDPVRTMEVSDPAEKIRDWELLQSLAYEPYFQISKFTLLMKLLKQPL